MNSLYPSEPNGGTWIGINDAGYCLALINWYSQPQYAGAPAFSRGEIIPRLLALSSREEMEKLLSSLPLERLNPFRLFLFGGGLADVREYRSNGSRTELFDHPWITGHWFSSGHDEGSATRARGNVCFKAADEADNGTIPWLQRLHTSHDSSQGADSVCMHREDAVTVSLTMLKVSGKSATMRYHQGSPCESPETDVSQTRLVMVV
jgi:hypothetical protein